MCGIIGYIDFSGRPIERHIFDRMTNVLAHRGPDDKGIKMFQGKPFVALGHRRLAIIDLSPNAHQPMSNEDEGIWIIYNGEIYNFMEIRKDLENRGYLFKSKSDAEVVIHAYEQWGEHCIQRFNGMFAFAIWDLTKKKLFVARDRLGIKPLYYHLTELHLLFSSEIKAILASKKVYPEVDWESLHNPWHFQASPKTGFKDIYKLAPGHFMTFSEKGLAVKKYWDIKPSEKDLEETEAKESLQELLRDAVRLQMIADVPVGALLSGGLDSSCIVSLMSQLTDFPVRTFTIRFTDQDKKFEAMPDDSLYAKKVTDLFGCDHQEIVIQPDIVDLLPKMVWNIDEPLADPAAINTYLISEAARESGVIVLLNGMGGDEVFGGYRNQLACLLAEHYQRYIPHIFRRLIEFIACSLPVASSKRGFKTLRWAKRFLSFSSHPQDIRFLLSGQSVFPDLYNDLFLHSRSYPYFSLTNVQAHRKFLRDDRLSYLTKMCLTDTKTFLPDHNLTYLDKAAMAASVEGRPPLLDHRIVEFMFGLHPRHRINGKTQKYLLKKAMEGYIPRDIIYRPKAPFGSPLRSWIRGSLQEMIDDLLNPMSLKQRGFYNPDKVWNLIQNDRKGREDNAQLIWTILSNEIWFRTFIDNQPI